MTTTEDTMTTMTTTDTNAADSILADNSGIGPKAPDAAAKARAKARSKSGTTGSLAAHSTADALGIIREWGKVYSLAATRCAMCGKPLRDSVSVTRGIGPDCSRQHYDVSFDITDSMVEDALGHLFASGLDSKVKSAAKALKSKPRDLCNVLVWWASAHLGETDTVIAIANIVTSLGFDSLGDRLRERNTDAVITKADDDSGDFILRCRSMMNVRRNMGRVKEATSVPREGRFKYGWRFPANRKGLVWTILGEDFGNQWATVPGKTATDASQVVKVPAATWRDVRAAFEQTYPRPTLRKRTTAAPAATIVRVKADCLEVHTPSRNFNFVDELKALSRTTADRKWSPQDRCWKVALKFEGQVRALVAKHFNGMV